MMIQRLALTLMVVASPWVSAWAEGSAKAGADLVETYCSECHTTERGGSSRKAPNLFGLVGRKAGQVPGFDYSDANKALGWVWDETNLNTYLTAPKTVVVGTTMKFKGIPDAAERADVIAFLASLH